MTDRAIGVVPKPHYPKSYASSSVPLQALPSQSFRPMKVIPLLAGFLLLLLALEGVAGARGDELVTVAPHRAAAASGNRDSMSPLLAFLTRPSGGGRFPAVVLLHGCYGFDGHDTAAASTLKAWGYVGLALDSLGDANMCGDGQPAFGVAAEVLDAYAALRYLTVQSFVANNKSRSWAIRWAAWLLSWPLIEEVSRMPNRQAFAPQLPIIPPARSATAS